MKSFTTKLFYVTIFLCCSIFSLSAQNESFCAITGAASESVGALASNGNFGGGGTNDPKYIKLYLHAIRQVDGTGGQSDVAIQTALDNLAAAFNPHNLFFIPACEIIDIPVSAQEYTDFEFYCELFYDPAYSQYHHTDGISIFFGVDDTVQDSNPETQNNGGVAINIPGKALWVAGRWTATFDNPPCILTAVFPHEVGHCLGLWHTHHGTVKESTVPCEGNGGLYPNQNCELVNEYIANVDESNFESDNGDFVRDTEADPSGWLPGTTCDNATFVLGSSGACFSSSEDFENCPPPSFVCTVDANGDLYTPAARNIMSRNFNISCRDEISTGQGLRIHKLIDNNEGNMQDCLINPIEISQNTIWTTSNTGNNGEIEINDNIIVKSGATFTISSGVTVRFAANTKIVVEPNAFLVLEGRLTNRSCDLFWQGIEVWGDNSQSQYSIGGVRAQGRFIGRPGSMIQNAETAIKLYGPTYNDAGGQISCNGTTFLNNSTAIEFAPYQNYWPFATSQQGQPRSYFGNFTDCVFLVDDDYSVSTPFDAFVSMTAVNGIRIYGSDFTNEQSPSSTNVQGYGYGIVASESGFRIDARCTANTYPCNSFDRSSFSGLGYGIQISNVTTSRPYILKQTDFTDCYYGLYNTGVSNATVLFNTFNLGQVPSTSASSDQFGVFLEMGLAGFTLQENDFIGTSGNVSNTAGTYCRHLDEFNNEIRRNTYVGLDVGNLAEGDNATSPLNKEERGLNYLCNYNDNISTADFWVGNVFGTNRIRQSQGLQEEIDNVITYSAKGNRFANAAFDFDNEGEAVDYYYYEQGAQEKPLTFFGITDIEAEENTCPVVYCEPPCKDSGEVAQEKDKYYQDQSKNETAKTEQEAAEASGNTTLANAKAKEASYYRQRMDQEAYMVVLHLMYDTTNFDIDTLATWVENLDVFSMDLIWALRQQSNGSYDEAAAALARATKRDDLSDQDEADLRDMPILLTALKGKQAHEVDSRHFKALGELTVNPESFTGNIAKNILRLHGYYFPPVYHFPERKKSEAEHLSFAPSQLAKELEVFPNPSNGQFTLYWNPINKSLESARLEIRNLTGRLVHNQQLTAFTQQAIDLSSQSAGIYYYHLHIGDDMPSISGKLIIQ